mgnify:CR=1 FL=1
MVQVGVAQSQRRSKTAQGEASTVLHNKRLHLTARGFGCAACSAGGVSALERASRLRIGRRAVYGRSTACGR